MHKNKVGRVSKGDKSEHAKAASVRRINGHACNLERYGGVGGPMLQIPEPLTVKSHISQTSKIQQTSPTTPTPTATNSRAGLTKLAGGNITMLDNRLSLEDRLRNKFSMPRSKQDHRESRDSATPTTKPQRKPSFDDPYAFSEIDAEPSKKKSMQTTISSISNLGMNVKTCASREIANHTVAVSKPSPASRPTSIARLYPQLAEKLERSVPGTLPPAPVKPIKLETDKPKAAKTEQKTSKASQRSSRTMNRLQTKIAQNKIKDKMKKTRSPTTGSASSQKCVSSVDLSAISRSLAGSMPTASTLGTTSVTSSANGLPVSAVSKTKTKSKPKASNRKQTQKDTCLRNALSTAPVPYVVHKFPSSLSASERLSQLRQSSTNAVVPQRVSIAETPQRALTSATLTSNVSSIINTQKALQDSVDCQRVLSSMLTPTLMTPPLPSERMVGVTVPQTPGLQGHPVTGTSPHGLQSLPQTGLLNPVSTASLLSPSVIPKSGDYSQSGGFPAVDCKPSLAHMGSLPLPGSLLPQLPADLKNLMGIHPPLLAAPIMPQQQPSMISPQPALTPPKPWLPSATAATVTPAAYPGLGLLSPGATSNINVNIPIPPTWWPPMEGAPSNPKLQPLSVIPPGAMNPTVSIPPAPCLPRTSPATTTSKPTAMDRGRCIHTIKPRRKRNLLSEEDVKTKIRRPSAVHLYSLHARKKVENSTFLPYGVDSSEEDDSDAEDLFPWQHEFRTTFSDSDDEEAQGDELDQEISSSIRRTKLQLVRCKLRRHCAQIRKSQKGSSSVRHSQQVALEALIDAIRDDEKAAVRALMHVYHQVKESPKQCKHPGTGRRPCLHKNDEDVKCGGKALPYANHCLKHIMYNVDQLMFDYCTAKFSNNTQCCVPVFDIRHELPLCPEHAAKADNYQKNLDSKPKKPRKRTKPSALTRPPKKGKKKKNQKKAQRLKKAKSPEPVVEEEDEEEEEEEETLDVAEVEDAGGDDATDVDVTSSGDIFVPAASQDSVKSYGGGASSSHDSGVEVNAPSSSLQSSDLQTDLQSTIDQNMDQSLDPEDDPLSPDAIDAIDKSLDLPLDQDHTQFFEEHDLHEVLDKLPEDNFDIFTGKNGDFISTKDEDLVLQQLVAEASQGVSSEDDKIRQALINENSNDDELTKQIAYSILNQNLSPTGSIGDDINHDNLNALASSISANDLKQISQVLTPSVLNSALGGVDAGGLGPVDQGQGQVQPQLLDIQNGQGTSGVMMQGSSSFVGQQVQQGLLQVNDLSANNLSASPGIVTQVSGTVDSIARGLLSLDQSLSSMTSSSPLSLSTQHQAVKQSALSLSAPQLMVPGNGAPFGATVLQLGTPQVLPSDLTPKVAAPSDPTVTQMAGLYSTDPQTSSPNLAFTPNSQTNLQLTWGQHGTSVPTIGQPVTQTLGLPNGFPTAAFPTQNLALSGLKFAYPVQALLPGAAVVATGPDGAPLNLAGQQFPAQTLLTIATSLAQPTQLQNTPSSDSVGLENGS